MALLEVKKKGKKVDTLRPGEAVKRQKMRDRFIRLGMRYLIAVLLTGGLAYLTVMWEEKVLGQHNSLQATLGQLSGEVNTLAEKLAKAEQGLPLYNSLIGEKGESRLLLDRQQAATLLTALKDQYSFSTLNVNMSPVTDVKGARFKAGGVIGLECSIIAVFTAPSDEHFFAFYNALKQQLPGTLSVNELSMTRLQHIDRNMASIVMATGRTDIVRGELKLRWTGIRLADKVKSPANGAPAPGDAP